MVAKDCFGSPFHNTSYLRMLSDVSKHLSHNEEHFMCDVFLYLSSAANFKWVSIYVCPSSLQFMLSFYFLSFN